MITVRGKVAMAFDDDTERWAREFVGWAVRNAFGPSTVNSKALRNHMLKNNADVKGAAEAVLRAKNEVNKYVMAQKYIPTPPAAEKALKEAERHLRQVMVNAKRAVGLSS